MKSRGGCSALATVALAAFAANAEEAVLSPPQGSDAFPTVGEIACLEDQCDAEYRCAGWRLRHSIEFRDGRISITPSHAIATRACEVFVTGEFSARWFTGVAGHNGQLTGVTQAHKSAEYRGTGQSLLAWLVENHGLTADDLSGQVSRRRCFSDYRDCWADQLEDFGNGSFWELADYKAEPRMICAAELAKKENDAADSGTRWQTYVKHFRSFRRATYRDGGCLHGARELWDLETRGSDEWKASVRSCCGHWDAAESELQGLGLLPDSQP